MGNVAIVKQLYENFARGDVAAVLNSLDPMVEWFEAEGYPQVGGRHVGHAGVLDAVSRIAADWDLLVLAPDEFADRGDCVVALGEASGTYRLSGRSFRSRFAHEWRLRNGLVTLWRAHLDTALVQAATRPAEPAAL